jgi:hypothetical protein
VFSRQQSKFEKLEQAKRDFIGKISDEQLRGRAADVIYGDDAFGFEEDGVAGKYKADSHSMYYDFVKANEDPSMMEEYIA